MQKNILLIAVVLCAGIFALDVRTPIGYAGYLLYVIPVLIAAPAISRRHIAFFSLLPTFLLISGFFLSPEGGDPARAYVNRGLALAAIWGTTFLIERRRRAEEALEQSYRDLEMRVDERTRELREANTTLQDEISLRKLAQEDLARSKAEFEALFNSMSDVVILTDTRRRILLINPAFTTQFGYTFDEVKGKTTRFLYSDPDDYDEQGRLRFHTGAEADRRVFNVQYTRRDGTHFWSESSGMRVRNSEGAILGFAVVIRDITERKKMEEEMRLLALHDPLTGLANRRFFTDISHKELAQARRNKKKVAFLFLDLDRFKDINDALGHEIGDALLRQVASRLQAQLRESDTIARIGGDEFVILLADLAHEKDGILIAEKIMTSFRRPFLITGNELQTSASIGISIYPDDAAEVDVLLRHADIALYYAKEQGRNNFQFYNSALNLRSAEKLRQENSLRQSIERGELEVYYQPLVDLRTGKIVNAEALVYWRHPEFGLLEPKQFLSAAEETGFIAAIDKWVLKTACVYMKSRLDAGASSVGVSVNLSSRNFQDPELAVNIASILKETGLPAEYLNVEIPETIAMRSIEQSIARMNELESIGVHIFIDKFGAGYSSLNHLKRLPVRKLKIDRSFVRDVMIDAVDRAVINAVTAMAHAMNIRVLAEGVETEEQTEFLRSADCDEIQGFAVSRPLTSKGFEEFMKKAA